MLHCIHTPSIAEVNSGEPCPACGSAEFSFRCRGTDRLYRTTSREFQVVECRCCHLIRLHPRPLQGELANYYPAHFWFEAGKGTADRLAELFRRLVLQDHLRFVRQAIASSGEEGPVLDVGCGGGLFLGMLRQGGAEVTGLDSSVVAASVAWRNLGVPAVCANLDRAPFLPSSFAVITMFHVLEHLFDPHAYLESARELLRARGRLVVQVPNADCWQFSLLGEKWSGLDIPRHLQTFRTGDLERLLERCGFEPVRRKYFSLRDNPTGLATSLTPQLDPMVRRVRCSGEGSPGTLARDILYFCLTAVALPLTLIEAACHVGSTVTVEARKKR